MDENQQIDQVIERVERLLMRHEELMRTNALLEQQLDLAIKERDGLKLRLHAARTRVDALIARLPSEQDEMSAQHMDETGSPS